MNIRRNEKVLGTAQFKSSGFAIPAFGGAGASLAWLVSLIATLLFPMPIDTSVFAVLGAIGGIASVPKFMSYHYIKAIATATAPSYYRSYPNLYSEELKKCHREYQKKTRIKGQSLNLLLRKPVEISVSSENITGGYGTRHEAIKIVGNSVTAFQYDTPSELVLWREAVANAMELR